jgi:hypothetical protein
MKLKFKVQPYQTNAVDSVVDCFAGQVNTSGIAYRIDPGVNKKLLAQGPTLPGMDIEQYPCRAAAAESALVRQTGVKRRMQGQP